MWRITTVDDLLVWADGLLGSEQTDDQTRRLADNAWDAAHDDPDGPRSGDDWTDWFEGLDDDTLMRWADTEGR